MAKGTLIIIGGHEDRTKERLILREVAHESRGKKLVVTTVASSEPEGLFETYSHIFRDFGIKAHKLELSTRGEALEPSKYEIMKDAEAVFFTGGDQLKITSQIGDTPIFERLRDIYEHGGVIAGTSAGASVMCETMLISGPGEKSNRSDHNVAMAPGLGFIKDVIIDQHFAERGRMGRLLGAVARNPRIIGLGIDENTAIIVKRGQFTVLGEGAVYVLDGRNLLYSNVAESQDYETLSILRMTMHVLSQGDRYHFESRTAEVGSRQKIEEQLMHAVHARGDKESHNGSRDGQ
jgi:cyanophycinase